MNGDTRIIQLSQGQVAVVDAADYETVSQFKWHAQRARPNASYYALRAAKTEDGRSTSLSMHRVLVGAKRGQFVDHIDGDGLNNRRANLRLCTASENCQNRRQHRGSVRTPYKGVTYLEATGAYTVQIAARGKRTYLGIYADPVEGALAYDAAALRLHGEFARLNFPDGAPNATPPRETERGKRALRRVAREALKSGLALSQIARLMEVSEADVIELAKAA